MIKLTKYEVLRVNDEPIFIEHKTKGDWLDYADGVITMGEANDLYLSGSDTWLDCNEYGDTWVAYRYGVNLIELYINEAEYSYFEKGVYYDQYKQAHELKRELHSGMLQDSVIIGRQREEGKGDLICLYFLKDDLLRFDKVMFHEQKGDIPILIHNTGDMDLKIQFERYPHVWTIKPGESKRIIPFCPDDARKGK